jgi:hypothetical protein
VALVRRQQWHIWSIWGGLAIVCSHFHLLLVFCMACRSDGLSCVLRQWSQIHLANWEQFFSLFTTYFLICSNVIIEWRKQNSFTHTHTHTKPIQLLFVGISLIIFTRQVSSLQLTAYQIFKLRMLMRLLSHVIQIQGQFVQNMIDRYCNNVLVKLIIRLREKSNSNSISILNFMKKNLLK